MKRLTTLLLTLTLATSALAATKIYRVVDADGNVIFTDVPPEQRRGSEQTSEVIDVRPANAYDSPDRRRDQTGRDLWIVEDANAEEGEPTDVPVVYTEVAVLSPAADEAVRANDGTILVSGAVRPELGEGHQVQLTLDGAVHSQSVSAQFTLTNVDRGTHSVSLSVVDQNGAVLATSATHRFHVLRAHR